MSESCNLKEKDVAALLDRMNLPHSNLGYPYLLHSIFAVCQDESLLNARRVMPLYTMVAEKFHTSPSRVERAIRAMLAKISSKMTNGQFIFWAVDTLKFQTSDPEVSA